MNQLSSRNGSGFVQAPGLNFDLAHAKFLYFPGDRHRKGIYKTNILRDFEMSDPVSAILPQLLGIHALSRLQSNPGRDSLAELLIRQTQNIYIRDFRMTVKEFLDLPRVDVLASANDHFLESAGDMKISVRPHHRQIARVQPTFRIDHGGRAIGILVVAFHNQIAARAQLTAFSRVDGLLARWIDDPDFSIWHDAAYGIDSKLQRVIGAGHGDDRRALRLPIGDRHARTMHLVHDALHYLNRARRPGHDAAAQRAQVEIPEPRVLELGNEHSGHPVQQGTALGLNGFQRGKSIEALCRQHERNAEDHRKQRTHHAAEAMIHGHRST